MKVGVLVTVILCSEVHVYCYNIDMKFPIVYSKPKDNITERNSYFGFSLILHKDWIQVGAPRANSTILGVKVMEPGVAYRCRMFQICEEVELDRNVNEYREGTRLIKDLKNHSWIGGAMAMGFGESGKVVVCGHRWKNQGNLKPEGHQNEPLTSYAMSGICYISKHYTKEEFSHNFEYTLPPEVYDTESHKDPYFGLFHTSQIGMSLYIAPPAEKKVSLLIGAPGAGPYWSGGVVEYARPPAGQIETRRKREVRREEYGEYKKQRFVYKKDLADIEQFTYFGYQVASGCFFDKDKLCHVASSPRGADLKGSVLVYRFNDDRSGVDQYIMAGDTIGEYFGGSLAVADVTGDKLHDLIVGSPLFSLYGDEGCIYVFTKNFLFNLRLNVKKIGLKIGGRFGTAVASLGDIDQDGYDDIAVGAPYEETGVVYIYNGKANGLSEMPSQRIKASDVHESINGFGISISRPADIDGNYFTDVAIGSYLSEHVVLLRSHPAIELISFINSHVKQLNVLSTKFVVNACLAFNGSENVPSGIDVIRTIDVDVDFHRFKQISSKPVTLHERRKLYCENITIEMKNESSRVSRIDDIKIELSQRLKEAENYTSSVLWVTGSSTANGMDKFCKFCSVVKKNHPAMLVVQYAQDCGDDNECVSDVELQCSLTQNGTLLKHGYVIGSSPFVKLTIYISNKGETLYSPKVKINIPKEINLAQIPQSCQQDKDFSSSVTCKFGPITNGQMNSVNISLDLSAFETLRSLWEKEHPLSVLIETDWEGNHRDTYEANNRCNSTLNLIMKVDVRIYGKSETDVYTPLKTDNENGEQELRVVHMYEVSNIEVSPVKHLETLLFIPTEWNEHGSHIRVSDPSIMVHQNGKTIFCSRTEAVLKHQETNRKAFLPEVNMERANSSDSYPSNRTLYLNCSSSNVKCDSFKCTFVEFRTNTVAKIVITSKLNMSSLASVMGQKDIVLFSTHGHIEIIGNRTMQQSGHEMKHETVTSMIIGTVPSEKIALWIIILCVIVGILLIATIVMGLMKAGFFKREKKEELMALKKNCVE